MRLTSLHIQNYKSLKEVAIEQMSPFSVFVGANGVGKSSLLDVFLFLKDWVVYGIDMSLSKREGLNEIVSRNSKGSIRFDLRLLDDTLTWNRRVRIGDTSNKDELNRELSHTVRPLPPSTPEVVPVGAWAAWYVPDSDEGERENKEIVQNEKFVEFFRRCLLVDFSPSAIRNEYDLNGGGFRSTRGENFHQFAYNLYTNYPTDFQKAIDTLIDLVPGLSGITPVLTEDRRVILRFQNGAFRDPFLARNMSDGTLKLFAYLLLLNDPNPPSLLLIEEPENHLYPSLLRGLAEQFSLYAAAKGQVIVTTHSTDFVDGCQLEEVFWMSKENGFTNVTHASDVVALKRMFEEGELPGALWRQGLFTGADPR